ncbi:MAG: dTDP-4-dehydrorhamnose reductase [Candidatus Competibacterales bacterium]|nr:dTDP-4-dehydrorhamnose reductase [Candidatus Competibacterales bacterium]
MRLLVTGGCGQVGTELAQRAPARGFKVQAPGSAELDITDASAVRRAVAGVDKVINAAAYTAVDRAEQEPERAYAANRDGPAVLATACAERGIPLLHLSTDYVFDGRRPGPYREDHPVAPLGVYGASKWAGEQAVRERLEQHLILRVSWVFGAYGHNFVRTMLRLAREREELRVVADQHGCPTHAGAIAETLLELAQRLSFSDDSRWGTYHYCGVPATTWHGFAEAILAQVRTLMTVTCRRVVAITTEDFPTPAPRPANSVLDCSRIAAVFGLSPEPWTDGLAQVLNRWCMTVEP